MHGATIPKFNYVFGMISGLSIFCFVFLTRVCMVIISSSLARVTQNLFVSAQIMVWLTRIYLGEISSQTSVFLGISTTRQYLVLTSHQPRMRKSLKVFICLRIRVKGHWIGLSVRNSGRLASVYQTTVMCHELEDWPLDCIHLRMTYFIGVPQLLRLGGTFGFSDR